MTRGLALDTFNKLDPTPDAAAPLVTFKLTPTPDVKLQCWLLPVCPAFGACVPPTSASPPPRPGRGQPTWASRGSSLPGLAPAHPAHPCGDNGLGPRAWRGPGGVRPPPGPSIPVPCCVNCPSHQQAQPVPRLQLRQKARYLLLYHLQTLLRAFSQKQHLQRPVEVGINPFPAVVGTLWS